jgi:hypothetical protein
MRFSSEWYFAGKQQAGDQTCAINPCSVAEWRGNTLSFIARRCDILELQINR